jgi:hypothetical protein
VWRNSLAITAVFVRGAEGTHLKNKARTGIAAPSIPILSQAVRVPPSISTPVVWELTFLTEKSMAAKGRFYYFSRNSARR